MYIIYNMLAFYLIYICIFNKELLLFFLTEVVETAAEMAELELGL